MQVARAAVQRSCVNARVHARARARGVSRAPLRRSGSACRRVPAGVCLPRVRRDGASRGRCSSRAAASGPPSAIPMSRSPGPRAVAHCCPGIAFVRDIGAAFILGQKARPGADARDVHQAHEPAAAPIPRCGPPSASRCSRSPSARMMTAAPVMKALISVWSRCADRSTLGRNSCAPGSRRNLPVRLRGCERCGHCAEHGSRGGARPRRRAAGGYSGMRAHGTD